MIRGTKCGRSRAEHEALDDGNRHGESASYRPAAGDHRADGRDKG